MKFEIGHFYRHPSAGDLAVLAEIKTTMWGISFVAESAADSGHFLMPVGRDETSAENWHEITQKEWMRNFDPPKAPISIVGEFCVGQHLIFENQKCVIHSFPTRNTAVLKATNPKYPLEGNWITAKISINDLRKDMKKQSKRAEK